MSKGLSRGDTMVDARGVKIEPGDGVIYGFGVDRSVAMAEGEIMDDGYGHVSTTPSGRVWVRIVRRSYGGGHDERVHVAPDRLVVLKRILDPGSPQTSTAYVLPPSPLPTQDQANREEIIETIERHVDDLQALLDGKGKIPTWAGASHRARGVPEPTEAELRDLAIKYLRQWITEKRGMLARIETRLPCCPNHGTEGLMDPHCACPCHMTEDELHL